MSSSKWWRAIVASCVASGLALTACGGGDDSSSGGASKQASSSCKPSAGKVSLTYWSWIPGMDKAVKLWNSENPNIQVKLKETPGGNQGTYQNMFNALKAGNQPDLGQIEYDILPSFRLQDSLVDIGPCGVQAQKGAFADWTYNQVSFGDAKAAYAVPQDAGPIGFYYRTDLFKKYGITPPKTWAEFKADAEKVHKQDPSVYMTHFPQRDTNWFAGLAWQAGAKWFGLDGDTWKVSIDDPATKKVADFWQSMIDEKVVATNLQGFSEQWNKALSSGKVISWVSAVWGNGTLSINAPKTKGKWAVAPMPQWEDGGQVAGNWGGSTTAVFKGSKHPAEAAKFALWLNTNPKALEILNKEGGIYPASTAGTELAPLQRGLSFFGGQKIFDVFKAASAQVDTKFQWGPTMTQTYSDLSDGFGRALNGSGTLDQAIAAAQSKTVSAMEQQSLKVAK